MLEQYAMDIYQQLAPMLPEDWEKVVMLGKIKPSTYDITFYVKSEGRSYLQCYAMVDQGLIAKQVLRDTIRSIFDICRKSQNEMEKGQEIWKSFTFQLDNEGNFSIDYDYEEFDVGVSSEWKEKYLK